MKRTLFQKYLSMTAAVILISFIVLGFILTSLVSNMWISEKKSLLSSNISSYADTYAEIVKSTNIAAYGNMPTVLRFMAGTIDAFVFIADTDGAVTLTSGGPAGSFTLDSDIINRACGGEYEDTGTLGGIYSEPCYTVAVPIVIDGRTIGAIFASTPIEGMNQYKGVIVKLFFISAMIALIFATAGAYLATYRLVRPLHEMAEAAKAMSNGDFSKHISVRGDDEIAELAEAFNNMSSSIATSESIYRSFTANVSHDLKTPMTTIAGFIDGIIDGTVPVENQKQYLLIVSDEVRRLSRLVTSMLNLARFEAGELRITPTEFNITDTICRTLIPLERLIDEKSLEIRNLENNDAVFVNADRDLIGQVIYNLVDNAIKFTNVGGYIEFTVKEKDRRVYVSVKNSGDGIPPNEINYIFERFYKTDKSRSMDKRGTGLGLYIVKTIITLHHGQINVRSVPGEYTEFVFWIPESLD